MQSSRSPSAPPSKDVRRVLVVDDNPDIHTLFERMLGGTSTEDQELDRLEADLFSEAPRQSSVCFPFNVAIDHAHQGEEAIEIVRRAGAPPHILAFVDVRMPPGIDGIQTAKQLWQHSPDLYIVICTAYSDHSWEAISEFLGSSPNLLVLRKPFETIEVRQIVACITTMYDVLSRMKSSFEALSSVALEAAGADALASARAAASAELSGLATLSVGTDGTVRRADAGVLRVLGVSPDVVLGKHVDDIFESGSVFATSTSPARRRVKTRHGNPAEVLLASAPVDVPEGAPPEFLLVVSSP